jgi:hypothetical protein
MPRPLAALVRWASLGESMVVIDPTAELAALDRMESMLLADLQSRPDLIEKLREYRAAFKLSPTWIEKKDAPRYVQCRCELVRYHLDHYEFFSVLHRQTYLDGSREPDFKLEFLKTTDYLRRLVLEAVAAKEAA